MCIIPLYATNLSVLVNELIQDEIAAGTPSDKIILGGFSQGAAMTYYTAFASDVKLAGAITMSGYLPIAADFESRINAINADTPLLACHGDLGTPPTQYVLSKKRYHVPTTTTDSLLISAPHFLDPIVKYPRGKDSFDHAQKHGVKGTFITYKGLPHSASMEELSDVAKFIKATLSATKL